MSVFADIAIAMDRAIKLKNNLKLPDAAREYNNLIGVCNSKIKSISDIAISKQLLLDYFVWVEVLTGVKEPGFVVAELPYLTTRKVVGDNVVETFRSILFIPGSECDEEKLVFCHSSDNKISYKFGNVCYLRNIKPVSYEPLDCISIPLLENVFSGLKAVERDFLSL